MNFNDFYIKLTLNDCEPRNIYDVDYQKFDGEDYLPLYFVVPVFYGCVSVIEGEDYLHIAEMNENLSILSDHKRLIAAVLEQINKLNRTKYSFNKDYCKIKLGNCVEKMSVDVILKISYAVVSFRGLLVEGHLMECFYENLSEANINDDFEIIESEK